jgi:hypothetical protein
MSVYGTPFGEIGPTQNERATPMLTPERIAALKPGDHHDGGGLYLQIAKTGARSWVYTFGLHGKRHKMGLGPAAAISLNEARAARDLAQRLVKRGINPITDRQRLRKQSELQQGSFGTNVLARLEERWLHEDQQNQQQRELTEQLLAQLTRLNGLLSGEERPDALISREEKLGEDMREWTLQMTGQIARLNATLSGEKYPRLLPPRRSRRKPAAKRSDKSSE